MANPPRTPGVYVEEQATLPPSVAEVSTAIPAFIGYTEKGPELVPTRIDTLLDYENLFGKAKDSNFTVTTQTTGDKLREVKQVTPTSATGDPFFLMYYSLRLYFQNGGGSCYVVSIGQHDKYDVSKASGLFTDGLNQLALEDEPTLILFPDAINLTDTNYYALCESALDQCATLKDRFCILDVYGGNVSDKTTRTTKVNAFRNGVKNGSNDRLKYGAAYLPYLQTSLPYQYADSGVTIQAESLAQIASFGPETFTPNGITVSYTGNAIDTPKVEIVAGGTAEDPVKFTPDDAIHKLTITRFEGTNGTKIEDKWKERPASQSSGFTVAKAGNGNGTVALAAEKALTKSPAQPSSETLASIKSSDTALYNKIKAALAQESVVLPPSPAIAGIYAGVDRARGVWKAPANVSLNSVIGPVSKITNDEQDLLNVDPTSGKSINAIRAFTGKGTLVWGARTLAGNDNEWRYINVRRLFNVIEESIQKATAFAVFESNDATTWLKVKAMIESYLFGLWERGALFGSTPAAAYFVNVGLGKTMTAQDILEGRMNVKVGVAAVRPAEFIILTFTHKLPTA